jgi:putative sporulation protein YtaF
MLCATTIGRVIDLQAAVSIGAVMLIALGVVSLLHEYLVGATPQECGDGRCKPRHITFSFGKLIIRIMAKPEAADMDDSKSISVYEALFLGLALGVDNMVATFAAGLMGLLPLYTPVLMGLIQMAFITSGIWFSRLAFMENLAKRFPYLPGAVLIMLGLLRFH